MDYKSQVASVDAEVNIPSQCALRHEEVQNCGVGKTKNQFHLNI